MLEIWAQETKLFSYSLGWINLGFISQESWKKLDVDTLYERECIGPVASREHLNTCGD
jgi:hypothetical protein